MLQRKERFFCILAVFVLCAALVLPAPALAAGCGTGNHDYDVSITKYATESEPGERRFVCKVCGDVYIEEIPRLGHVWGPWIVDREATCTQAGSRHRVCTKHPDTPHSEKGSIPMLEHEYAQEEIAPTCTENGYTQYTCIACGDTYTDTMIPATGHAFGVWIVDAEATQSAAGSRHRVCAHDASHRETAAIPMLEPTPAPPTPTPAPLPSRIPRATLAPLNTADVVLTTSNTGVFFLLGGLLLSDLYVLRWHRAKRNAVLKKKREEAEQANDHS